MRALAAALMIGAWGCRDGISYWGDGSIFCSCILYQQDSWKDNGGAEVLSRLYQAIDFGVGPKLSQAAPVA